MRILYGIQGTGHGHISRARELLPWLNKEAELDIILSGYNCKLNLNGFNIIRKRGISFEYDAKGCVSFLDTAKNIRPVRFLHDIHSIPVAEYDLVISDYEPVTSWAALSAGVTCIGLSHQSAFYSGKSPRPGTRSVVAEQVLKHFAPYSRPIGFHFKRYDHFIEPPIIRSQVQELKPTGGNHISVYLPAFDHETLMSIFKKIRSVRWEIFSPYCENEYISSHITVKPVDNDTFLKSLENCCGVLTSAGFETCSEAMYLGKKLAVIPIRNQYEQYCNAAALHEMGVTVINNWGSNIINKLTEWIEISPVIKLAEIADAQKITNKLIRFARKKHLHHKQND